MKMRTMITGLAAALGIGWSASPVLAQSYYLQLDGGAAFYGDNDADGADIEYDVGYVVGGRVGELITDNIRAEIDVAYSQTEIDEVGGIDIGNFGLDADVSVLTLGIGVYADVLQYEGIDPYVGAGIGAAYKELETNFDGNDDETDLQVHGEFGVSFDLTPNIAVVPHYRLLWLDGVFDDEQFLHLVRLGIRISP